MVLHAGNNAPLFCVFAGFRKVSLNFCGNGLKVCTVKICIHSRSYGVIAIGDNIVVFTFTWVSLLGFWLCWRLVYMLFGGMVGLRA